MDDTSAPTSRGFPWRRVAAALALVAVALASFTDASNSDAGETTGWLLALALILGVLTLRAVSTARGAVVLAGLAVMPAVAFVLGMWILGRSPESLRMPDRIGRGGLAFVCGAFLVAVAAHALLRSAYAFLARDAPWPWEHAPARSAPVVATYRDGPRDEAPRPRSRAPLAIGWLALWVALVATAGPRLLRFEHRDGVVAVACVVALAALVRAVYEARRRDRPAAAATARVRSSLDLRLAPNPQRPWLLAALGTLAGVGLAVPWSRGTPGVAGTFGLLCFLALLRPAAMRSTSSVRIELARHVGLPLALRAFIALGTLVTEGPRATLRFSTTSLEAIFLVVAFIAVALIAGVRRVVDEVRRPP